MAMLETESYEASTQETEKQNAIDRSRKEQSDLQGDVDVFILTGSTGGVPPEGKPGKRGKPGEQLKQGEPSGPEKKQSGAAESQEKILLKDDYLDQFAQTEYAEIGANRKIADIYKDNKLSTYMEKIFDDESSKELKRGTFKVNLSSKDGLAGIIIAIRDAVTNRPNPLYDTLAGKQMITVDSPRQTLQLHITKRDLRKLIDDGLLIYTHDTGLDNEVGKISKILMRAKREDLDTFASLVQSKTDITKSVKELYNAQELTGNVKEDKERTEGRASLINPDNVLQFLCDFNSDGQISAAYNRKHNKEQKNQGDVGTLFGQQVLFTIEQAIGIKNIELGTPKGEQLVISNIVKNMTIADSRNLTYAHLVAMQHDPSACTKENLTDLLNGNPDKGVTALPEMKIFFLDAISKINGGSNAVQPDLYDTLVGRDAEEVMNLYETEADLKATIDTLLKASQDPEIQLQIREQGLVRVRETFVTRIMTALDHVEIIGNDGTRTQLGAAGAEKGRETQALKRELLEQTIQSLIMSGIHKTSDGLRRFSLGYGREGTSESGKTKRARGTGGGVIIGPENIGLALNLSGEIAEQYNYTKVINADLSKVRSAKYAGIEGGAIATIGISDRGVTPEAYAGLNRQQDPVIGINQIDKQYRAVSEEIFDLTGASAAQLTDKESFRSYLQSRIVTLQNDATYGRFVTQNAGHLKDSLDYMVRYMEANRFFGENGIIKQFPQEKLIPALNALLDIMQSGAIESRRSDVIATLHGHLALTKLSFGVTTSVLTARAGLETPSSPPPTTIDPLTGLPVPAPHPTVIDPLAGTQDKSQDRFGVFGFYVGARISTRRNSYVPNEAQYLFTQHEIGQGIGTEIINNPAVDLDIYGNYLLALFNDQQNRLSYTVDAGRLILTFDPKGSSLTLAQFLNLHTTKAAESGISLRGNTLTIGNISDIGAYTVTEGKGVIRVLCLGTKKRDETYRITGDIGPESVDPMKRKELGNKPWTKEKIDKEIVGTMTGEGQHLEAAKTETAAFFDKDGKLQTPKGAIVTFTPTTLEGMLLKDNGTLTIQKTSANTYTVSFDATSSPDGLTITYLDQITYKKSLSASELKKANRTLEKDIPEQDIIHAFDISDPIKNAFTSQAEKALSVFDDYDKTLYKEFMESIVDAGVDAFIGEANYTKAFATLKTKILEKNPHYDSLPDLKKMMDDPMLTFDQKRYIVDAFKPIFSYIINLTDGKQDGMNLEQLIKRRKDIYTGLTGPDDATRYPLTTDYRKSILQNLKSENQLTRKRVETLIGFTAFYRLSDKGRKYAMTPIGGTNVLSGSNLDGSLRKLDATDIPKTKERFFNNLDVNPENKKHVLEKIEHLLHTNNINLPASNKEQNIMAMLRGKALIIQDISIDSFKKININVDWVFYLLGECGNESLGMNIKNISIKKFTPIEPVGGRYSGKGIPETSYEGVNMAIKSDSIANRVLTQEEKVSGKFFGKLFERKGKSSPGNPEHPTGPDPTKPPNPEHPTGPN